MFKDKFLFFLFILLFTISGQTSVANKFTNINPDAFCSSNEKNNNKGHCNLCLVCELDYFDKNKYYFSLLQFDVEQHNILITLFNNPKIYPRSNSPPM